jgi:hypothetical protein
MTGRRRHLAVFGLAVVVAVFGLPLLGAWWAGRDLAPLTEFPPAIAIPPDPPRFSWFATALVVAVVLATVGGWLSRGRKRAALVASGFTAGEGSANPAATYPWWGWIALAWTGAWWLLAWTRFAWFAPLQRFTFFPLWLGFIVSVNAAVNRRSGTCLLRHAPGRWCSLFLASAAFWWSFEWLNRFVQNWHYAGGEDFTAPGYALHATLCFSTVLPAVAAVADWLGTFPRLQDRLAAGPAWTWLASPAASVGLVVGGAGALLLTGAKPLHAFAALWLAPLALLLGTAGMAPTPLLRANLVGGDWRRAGSWMLAALACGFFWELWNVRSFPKWIYTVPYVDRWHVFEMPILGYAGYLPFGLECALVVEWLFGAKPAGDRPSR